MNFWPATVMPTMPTIHTFSPESMGSIIQGISSKSIANNASVAWTANLAVYIPFTLSVATTFVKMYTMTGNTAAGNVDVAIYSSNGATRKPDVKLTSAANVAQSGSFSLQVFDITDITLSPGLYYFAVSNSSTGNFEGVAIGTLVIGRTTGVMQEAAANPLPAVATPVAWATADFIPVVGASQVTTIS